MTDYRFAVSYTKAQWEEIKKEAAQANQTIEEYLQSLAPLPNQN